MNIVVIGGTGLIGSNVVNDLNAQGHEAVAASPNSGVNTLTGEGLAEVLADAAVVVDVSNSPSFEDAAVLEFFETSTRHLLTAMADAGSGHLVALSVVGSERLPDSGYLRAKVAQEKLIKTSGIPFSIVHATQFFEFIGRIADEATQDGVVRLPSVLFQPGAATDVAAAVADVAVGAPLMGAVEIGGPEQFQFDELVRTHLAAHGDPRVVVADPHARYFNTELAERSLVPGDGARLLPTTYAEWARRAHSPEGVAVSAAEGATFVPRFLDGSPHVPQGNDAYVHVRLAEPARPAELVTVYLADGTTLIVSGCDLLQLAPTDD